MDGSRRSPGFASKDVSFHSASGYYNRPSQISFAGFPVTDCDFLAYSCAAARDLHPLPIAPAFRRATIKREPKIEKETETTTAPQIYRGRCLKVKRPSQVPGLIILELSSFKLSSREKPRDPCPTTNSPAGVYSAISANPSESETPTSQPAPRALPQKA